jgi:hypothetical protein
MIATKDRAGLHVLVAAHVTALRRISEEWASAFEQRANDVALSIDHFLDRRDKAEASGQYTPAGLGQQIKSAALALRVQLVEFRRSTTDKLTEQINAKRAAAVRPPSATTEDATLRHLRHREVRDLVRSLPDSIDRRLAFDRAVAAGDADFIQAIAEAPRGFELVDAAVVDAARIKAAEANDPEVARLVALRDAYSVIVNTANEEVKNILLLHGIALDGEPAKLGDLTDDRSARR